MAEIIKENALGKYLEHAMPSEPGEGVRLARGRFLDELPGIAFAAITLFWIVSMFAGLTWRELPVELTAHVRAIMQAVLGSHALTLASRLGSVAGFTQRAYAFIASRNAP